jgi:flagellar assembly protein FliH
MRLSKEIIKANLASKKVLEYEPPKLEFGTPEVALQYLQDRQSRPNDFRMSDVIRVQTGVDGIEARSLEETVEAKVLERLREVQEPAYQEAYQLGLDEGKKEAFNQASSEIEMRLKQLDVLIQSITQLKKDLVQHNESHLVQLAFHMAHRIAAAEIKADPSSIVEVIRKAVELAQLEENVSIQVAPSQLEFLESLKGQGKRDLEFLKKVKFVPVDSIREGGCIIETNYGVIDARFEERVEKLWTSIAENLYRVKDKVSAA